MQKTEKKNDRTYIVTELCPNCGNEIEIIQEEYRLLWETREQAKKEGA